MMTELLRNSTLFLFWQLAFEFMFVVNVIVDALFIYGMVKAYQKYDAWVQKYEPKERGRRRHGR